MYADLNLLLFPSHLFKEFSKKLYGLNNINIDNKLNFIMMYSSCAIHGILGRRSRLGSSTNKTFHSVFVHLGRFLKG